MTNDLFFTTFFRESHLRVLKHLIFTPITWFCAWVLHLLFYFVDFFLASAFFVCFLFVIYFGILFIYPFCVVFLFFMYTAHESYCEFTHHWWHIEWNNEFIQCQSVSLFCCAKSERCSNYVWTVSIWDASATGL